MKIRIYYRIESLYLSLRKPNLTNDACDLDNRIAMTYRNSSYYGRLFSLKDRQFGAENQCSMSAYDGLHHLSDCGIYQPHFPGSDGGSCAEEAARLATLAEARRKYSGLPASAKVRTTGSDGQCDEEVSARDSRNSHGNNPLAHGGYRIFCNRPPDSIGVDFIQPLQVTNKLWSLLGKCF